jgi:hypothetical protein
MSLHWVALQVFALSKVIKMVRVPLLNPGALSAPVTFVLPELSKLFVHAKSGSFILFVAFGMDLPDFFCQFQVSSPFVPLLLVRWE